MVCHYGSGQKDAKLARYDLANQSWQHYSLNLPQQTDLALGPDQQLWLLVQNQTLYQLKEQQLQTVTTPENFYATALEVDPLGQVWLLSAQKLYLYQPDTNSWQTQQLAQPWVQLFADRHQNIWLADSAGALALAQSSALAVQASGQLLLQDNKNQSWQLEQQQLVTINPQAG